MSAVEMKWIGCSKLQNSQSITRCTYYTIRVTGQNKGKLLLPTCSSSGRLATAGGSPLLCYESSRIVEKPFKHLFARVARGCAPCLGYGAVPHFSLFLRRRRRRKRKKVFRGHPYPRQRAAALCTPALKKATRTFQVPEKFGMTHSKQKGSSGVTPTVQNTTRATGGTISPARYL